MRETAAFASVRLCLKSVGIIIFFTRRLCVKIIADARGYRQDSPCESIFSRIAIEGNRIGAFHLHDFYSDISVDPS